MTSTGVRRRIAARQNKLAGLRDRVHLLVATLRECGYENIQMTLNGTMDDELVSDDEEDGNDNHGADNNRKSLVRFETCVKVNLDSYTEPMSSFHQRSPDSVVDDPKATRPKPRSQVTWALPKVMPPPARPATSTKSTIASS